MFLPASSPVGLWPAMFALQGAGSETTAHRHHAMHLMLARSGRLRATLGSEPSTLAGILTPPGFVHAVDASETTVVMLFMDPESDAGRALKRMLGGAPRHITDAERDALLYDLPAHPTGAELDGWIHRALEALGVGDGQRAALHPKVRELLKLLATAPLDPPPALASYADRVGLSSSRLMHVFTESTGTPWRTYLRWLRFQRAAAALLRGASPSQAAQEGGFSDAAHLTRTFREMYGVTPSQLRPPRDAG